MHTAQYSTSSGIGTGTLSTPYHAMSWHGMADQSDTPRPTRLDNALSPTLSFCFLVGVVWEGVVQQSESTQDRQFFFLSCLYFIVCVFYFISVVYCFFSLGMDGMVMRCLVWKKKTRMGEESGTGS